MIARITSQPFWTKKIKIAMLALATYMAMC
jgi:hypothetical protein